jgi:DNA helicase HerA-like ATPase
MLGNIIEIDDNLIKVKMNFDINSQSSLMNLNVIFVDGNSRFVGEIIGIKNDNMIITLLGEIVGETFFLSTLKKPSFKATPRLIKAEELGYLYGGNEMQNEKFYIGRSALYSNYKLYAGLNSLFSNHFAILGNTGSGKSFTVARLIQNLFTNPKFPNKSNIFIFDAYGEYNHAFEEFNKIVPSFRYKKYTTATEYPDGDILKIPLCLLDVDDLAILLGATTASQIPIIEKALRFARMFANNDDNVVKYKNSLLARAILDIILSGGNPNHIRDQVIALLESMHTDELNLETPISQPGYVRNIKQCLYVDNNGKSQDIEAVVNFLNNYLIDIDYSSFGTEVYYNLKDLLDAFDFALISEGILKSDKVYDETNVLRVRLRSILDSDKCKYFEYDNYTTKAAYVKNLLTNKDGTKAQVVNFNISYVDDRFAKAITKIISKILYNVSVDMKERGSLPFHIVIEEAHRYVQNDADEDILGYNIFNRIAKEGRKYGILLILISQRPYELSTTTISQCANFFVLKLLHPDDIEYVKKIVPNVNNEVVKRLKSLNPGSLIAFGNAFKVPTVIDMDKPNPEPLSKNVEVTKVWYE